MTYRGFLTCKDQTREISARHNMYYNERLTSTATTFFSLPLSIHGGGVGLRLGVVPLCDGEGGDTNCRPTMSVVQINNIKTYFFG
jgi:hypothetical protein